MVLGKVLVWLRARNIMKRILIALLLCVSTNAYAQTPVVTQPYTASISAASKTIGSTNVFQSILSASTQTTGRVDCIVQNKAASNSMSLFFGPIANATTPNSLSLAAGAIFRCANSGVVIKDQISITGTSGDAFFALQE